MRYYIIGNDGNVYGESDNLKKIEIILETFPTDVVEGLELEIVKD